MSLSLPLTGTALRDRFTVEHLISYHQDRSQWQGLQDAKAAALKTMRAETMIKAITKFVVTADGHLRLIEFGPRGGHRRLWDFGAV